MKHTFHATKVSALLSGVALGLGMPAIEAIGQAIQATQTTQNVLFAFGLITLLFGPVLLFVVGTAHLSIRLREMLKRVYWSSLGQVALRSVVWLLGCSVGFALLAGIRRAAL